MQLIRFGCGRLPVVSVVEVMELRGSCVRVHVDGFVRPGRIPVGGCPTPKNGLKPEFFRGGLPSVSHFGGALCISAVVFTCFIGLCGVLFQPRSEMWQVAPAPFNFFCRKQLQIAERIWHMAC